MTHAAGPVKSTVDYIIVQRRTKQKVRNDKVISNDERVPKHKLLVMDICNTIKTWRKKFEPRKEAQGGKDLKNTKAWSKIR